MQEQMAQNMPVKINNTKMKSIFKYRPGDRS